MAITYRSSLVQSQDPGASLGTPTWGQGPKELTHVSVFFFFLFLAALSGTSAGSWFEAEAIRIKLASIWDGGMTHGGSPYHVMAQAPIISFFETTVFSLGSGFCSFVKD